MSDQKLFVLLVLVALVSVSCGASLRHVGARDVEEGEDPGEVEKEEDDVDTNMHSDDDTNQHADEKQDENAVDVANQEVADGDDEDQAENGADDTTAAGDGGDAETVPLDQTNLIKDIREVKKVNEKLQGEMDTLNSEFDEVLKADDSKKDDKRVVAENKDHSEQDDSDKGDSEHANIQDNSEDVKPSEKDLEGKSNDSDQRKSLEALQVDTRLANYDGNKPSLEENH